MTTKRLGLRKIGGFRIVFMSLKNVCMSSSTTCLNVESIISRRNRRGFATAPLTSLQRSRMDGRVFFEPRSSTMKSRSLWSALWHEGVICGPGLAWRRPLRRVVFHVYFLCSL